MISDSVCLVIDIILCVWLLREIFIVIIQIVTKKVILNRKLQFYDATK